MRIAHNMQAMNALRMGKMVGGQQSKSLEKLSSGQRINRAGDDAAGLAISEKMRSQIRGLNQASRNIQDGISLVQTAEGGLNEVHSLLQRGRELAVQASNGTYTDDDKKSIQEEIKQIKEEVDRIASTTQFNKKKILNAISYDPAEIEKVVAGLQTGGWLKISEDLIVDAYGLTADNVQMEINFYKGQKGGALAYVQGTPGAGGKYDKISLNLDLEDFIPSTDENGGSGPYYNDRIIAHEMVHAVMSRSMDFTSLPTWFKEGTAEFIHGADVRVKGDLAAKGGDAQALIDSAKLSASWAGGSAGYSVGYAAVRYLHSKATASGGIKAIMTDLKGGKSLNDAIADNSSYTSLNDFISDFEGGNGATFINNMDLNNADTGSVKGSDAGSGSTLNAEDVIKETTAVGTWTADTANDAVDVLSGFTEKWNYAVTTDPVKIQLGANAGETLEIELTDASSGAVGIDSVDVTADAQGAITKFDDAIKKVSADRAYLGSIQNRLEHAMKVTDNYSENLSASESRIRDLDLSSEMMKKVKLDILSQASMSMVSMSKQNAQGVLQLLN